jgi:hypothetical protein
MPRKHHRLGGLHAESAGPAGNLREMGLRWAYESVRCPTPSRQIGDGCAPRPGIAADSDAEPIPLQGFGLEQRADLGVARQRGDAESVKSRKCPDRAAFEDG